VDNRQEYISTTLAQALSLISTVTDATPGTLTSAGIGQVEPQVTSVGVDSDMPTSILAPTGETKEAEDMDTTPMRTDDEVVILADPAETPGEAKDAAQVDDDHDTGSTPQSPIAAEPSSDPAQVDEAAQSRMDNPSDTDHDLTPDYRPLTKCFTCNKLDSDIALCDDCETPHHQECLIKDPDGGNEYYCHSCTTNQSSNQLQLTQPSLCESDLRLSESTSAQEDSDHSEFVLSGRGSKAPTSQAGTLQHTAPPYRLRDRKKDGGK
jgi:hypothetical protein